MADNLDLALSLSATDMVDTAGFEDVPAAIRGLTGGRGVDHSFEALGVPALVTAAVRSLAVRGPCTIVVFPDDSVFEIPFAAIRPECRIRTCRMGWNQFRVDIPRYLEFHRQGRLDLESMITAHPGLDGCPSIARPSAAHRNRQRDIPDLR